MKKSSSGKRLPSSSVARRTNARRTNARSRTALRDSLREAHEDIAAYVAGDASRVRIETVQIPDDIDVKAIREDMALSQSQFARLFGFNLSVVQSWERTVDRKRPSRATRVLLTVLHRNPSAVLAALAAESERA